MELKRCLLWLLRVYSIVATEVFTIASSVKNTIKAIQLFTYKCSYLGTQPRLYLTRSY